MPRRLPGSSPTVETIALHLTLDHIEPAIWRIVRVPSALSLEDLHHVNQAVMGWQDYHLHRFEVAGAFYGSEMDEPLDGYKGQGGDVTVADALERGGGSIGYEYDFGDGWRVTISRAEGRWSGRGAAVAECLDGDLAGPREDSGGPHAYTETLAATLAGRGKLRKEVREWLGPDFDPRRFDREAVNRTLAGLTSVRQRRAGRRSTH